MKTNEMLLATLTTATLWAGCDVDREFDGMDMDGAAESELPDGVEANDMILIIENDAGGRIHLWVDFTRDGELLWGTSRATRWASDDDEVLWRPVGPTDDIGFLPPFGSIEQQLTMSVSVPTETSYFDEAKDLYLIFDATHFSETLICGTVSDELHENVDEAQFVAWPVMSVDDPMPDVTCEEM